MECKRCGQPAQRMTLMGGYTAQLCDDCRNEWQASCLQSEMARLLRWMQTKHEIMLCRVASGTGLTPIKDDDFEKLSLNILEIERNMFAAAAAFCSEQIEPAGETAKNRGPVKKLPIDDGEPVTLDTQTDTPVKE